MISKLTDNFWESNSIVCRLPYCFFGTKPTTSKISEFFNGSGKSNRINRIEKIIQSYQYKFVWIIAITTMVLPIFTIFTDWANVEKQIVIDGIDRIDGSHRSHRCRRCRPCQQLSAESCRQRWNEKFVRSEDWRSWRSGIFIIFSYENNTLSVVLLNGLIELIFMFELFDSRFGRAVRIVRLNGSKF